VHTALINKCHRLTAIIYILKQLRLRSCT